MEIKVFGAGCARCAEMEQRVREVITRSEKQIKLCKVTDFKEMMTAGILSTPTLSIDGHIKCTGRVPAKEEIARWIDEASVELSNSVDSTTN